MKRKCLKPVSVEALDIFSHVENSECECGVNSDCESGKWSSAQASNDIYVPSFVVEVGRKMETAQSRVL